MKEKEAKGDLSINQKKLNEKHRVIDERKKTYEEKLGHLLAKKADLRKRESVLGREIRRMDRNKRDNLVAKNYLLRENINSYKRFLTDLRVDLKGAVTTLKKLRAFRFTENENEEKYIKLENEQLLEYKGHSKVRDEHLSVRDTLLNIQSEIDLLKDEWNKEFDNIIGLYVK